MTVEQIRATIEAHRPELEEFGIESIRVFGSVARGEARPDSDVDLLVSLQEPVGLIRLARLQRQLSEWLGCKVDLVTPGGLHPALRDGILAEAVRAA